MSEPEFSTIIRVAIPCPLYHDFDYFPPPNTDPKLLISGVRVVVPFRNKKLVGLLIECAASARIDLARIQPAIKLLDDAPVLSIEILNLLRWAADYYHYPFGEVIWTALPVCLRKPLNIEASPKINAQSWRLTNAGYEITFDKLRRAKMQSLVLDYLRRYPNVFSAGVPETLPQELLNLIRSASSNDNANVALLRALQALRDRNLVTNADEMVTPAFQIAQPQPVLILNHAQQTAVNKMVNLIGFQVALLEGVTGSGKTEVYLEVAQQVINQNRQVLILVPEIGLTPQFVARLQQRFAVPLAVLHSKLSAAARCIAWNAAVNGSALIIIGTRSAIFTPLPHLGLIVVDEEHDHSFKQWEGFRYHARDLAVMRARRLNIPIILGSATPSLETLHNVQLGRYHHVTLAHRAGDARPPCIKIVDLRAKTLIHGLAEPVLHTMAEYLARDEQVLIFINRRGYAPVLLCHQCGWFASCHRCDARLTFHREDWQLRCHHCGAEQTAPRVCPKCSALTLQPLGAGTERLEHALINRFPDYPLIRIDRDTTRRQGALTNLLNSIKNKTARILVGTQMLAKGHDFPEVTLVVIVNLDQGLHGTDFRDSERLAQLLTQVAGRAGRADKPGQVLLQTHTPNHPLLITLIEGGYSAFAKVALIERAQAQWPPFWALALLWVEAMERDIALEFLTKARDLALTLINNAMVQVYGPIPAPMERRAGRYRAQLLLQAQQRNHLQKLLAIWRPCLENLPAHRRVRWSLNVDP